MTGREPGLRPNDRPIAELVHDPPSEWVCKHRRQEEKMTDPFGLSLGGLVIREYQVNTARPRWVDGLVLHVDARGMRFPTGVICGKCLGDVRRSALNPYVRGSRATLIQTKRKTLGTVLLGQTLFGGLALELLPWAPTSLDLVSLCTAHSPELETLLPRIPGCERLRVEVGSLDCSEGFRPGVERRARPNRQIVADHDLRAAAAAALGLERQAPTIQLDSGERAEAVYETGDGLLIMHAAPKPMSLALAGLVLFFREALAARFDHRYVQSVSVTTQPDPIVTGLLRQYSGCDALRPDGRPW